MNATLKIVGDWGFFLFALGLLLLGSAFLGFTRWWDTPTGRGYAILSIAINAVITLSFLRLFGALKPDSTSFWMARAIVFAGGGLAVLVIGVMFVRLQFIRRRSGELRKSEVPGELDATSREGVS